MKILKQDELLICKYTYYKLIESNNYGKIQRCILNFR